MKELTDSVLSQDMGEANITAIVFLLILLLLILLIIIRVYSAKKGGTKHNPNASKKLFKGYGYKTAITIIIIMIVALVLNIIGIFKQGQNADWYVTYGTIINKYEKMTTSDPGARKTYYYVTVQDNDRVLVTKNEYDKLKEGDEVYILRHKNGSAEEIYLTKEYKYTGTRLKEN